MNRYPNISDHGLIGDLQTAALVTTDGTLDWFCCPRFDSPSVFASLLDAERGGFYRIAPDRDDYVSKQLYLPDTAILVTRFMTPDGVGEVHDFMPVIEGPATGRHRLVRNIRVVRGVMRFAIQIEPRFDYGRKPHELEAFEHGGVFRSEDLELTAHAIAPEGATLQEAGVTIRGVPPIDSSTTPPDSPSRSVLVHRRPLLSGDRVRPRSRAEDPSGAMPCTVSSRSPDRNTTPDPEISIVCGLRP